MEDERVAKEGRNVRSGEVTSRYTQNPSETPCMMKSVLLLLGLNMKRRPIETNENLRFIVLLAIE